ncbi:hypothetical protein TrST_g2984 [Triparma strigata]|uniref:Uncharacterized protein n=1 Tax=Triparma strigata TaxID=1606541 RepID=A0A9W6ZUA9_9STRA|nr:hypothetical protein TrST_g2984 [Triparma strigata]
MSDPDSMPSLEDIHQTGDLLSEDVPENDTASVTNNIIATTPPPPPLESTTTDDTLRAQAEAAVALSLGTLSPDGLLTQERVRAAILVACSVWTACVKVLTETAVKEFHDARVVEQVHSLQVPWEHHRW